MENMTTKKIVIHCERCAKIYRTSVVVHEAKIKGENTGVMNVLIRLPCKHLLVATIDMKGSIRGTTFIDKECDELESIRLHDSEDQIRELERKHARLSREGKYNDAFKLMAEVSTLKREREEMSRGIR